MNTTKIKDNNKLQEEVMEALSVQGLLLSSDELLIFRDEKAEYHILSTQPYDKEKKYRTLFMTWEDLKAG